MNTTYNKHKNSQVLNFTNTRKIGNGYIFNEYTNRFGQHKVEVVCPFCHNHSTHGKVNLDMARGCNWCHGSYYITKAPADWTPPPVPFHVSDIGEHPEKYGLRGTVNDVIETAEEFTEAFYKQQRYRLLFRRWPKQEIDELENRQRAEYKKLEEMEAKERRRKIVTHRCKDDLTSLKKMLPQYLRAKGITVQKNLLRCPGHDDKHPSAVAYFNQPIPRIYCPVCAVCMDIFNIAGLLIGSSDFRLQLAEIKTVLGVENE